MSSLQVAAARVPLRCDDSMILAGSIQPARASGQQGELRATALVIRADVPVCIVACDVVAITRDLADRVARVIERSCGIPFDNVLITASHTHHAPSTIEVHAYGPEPRFCQRLESAMLTAVRKATTYLEKRQGDSNAVEAEFRFSLSQEATVGANSRLLLKGGSVAWTRHDPSEVLRPTGPFDPDLPVVVFSRPSGSTAAFLFNHSTHNIGRCGPGGRSPGFYGMAAQSIEPSLNATGMFLPGAFGSTHNIHLSDTEAQNRIRRAIIRGIGSLRSGLRGPVAAIKRPFEFRVRAFDDQAEDSAVSRYCRKWFDAQQAEATIEVFRAMRKKLAPQQGEARQTWLQVVRLGEVVLVGIPGEMFAELGLAIRRRSPFRHTFVVGLANDEIGYIPDDMSFDYGGYQLWTGLHSILPRGDGERMVEAAVGMLGELHAGSRPSGGDAAPEPVTRELRADEAQPLQTFYNSLSAEARRLFRPLGWNATLEVAADICAATGAEQRYDLVLDAGGRIVGWAFLTALDTDVAHLGIGVAEAFVGRGLGKQLMDALIAHARRRGTKAIALCHVAGNERAHRLYESCGFVATDSSRSSDGLDYVRMRLTLQP